MASAYAQVAALGPRRVSLDFGRVGYINSTGIALVVRLLADARRDGRTVRAIGLTEHYREIFRITRSFGLHGDRGRRRCMTATVIELDQQGPAAILRIEGDVTSASEGDLMAAYGLAVANGETAVVLDFARLEYMNSGGIGLLVTLLVRAQRAGGRLVATGLSEHYRQIFSLTRLDEAIEITDDEAAAVAAATD